MVILLNLSIYFLIINRSLDIIIIRQTNLLTDNTYKQKGIIAFMKYEKKWTLNFKNAILIPCTIVISLIVIILFWLPSIRYSSLFQSQAENYNQNIIRQTNLGIAQSLLQFEEKIKKVIDDPRIRNFLSSDRSTNSFQYEYQNIIEEYFDVQSLDAYYLECLDIYPLNQADNLQYGYKSTDIKQIRNSTFYEHALIYPTNLNWLPYNTEEECLELTRCIYSYTDYTLQGILVIRLSHDFLLDKFQNLSIVDADCMYILDSQNQIICSTDISLSGTKYPDTAWLTEDSGTYSKNSKLYSYAHVRSTIPAVPYDKWVTIIQLDEKLLFANFRRILYVFNVLAGIILIISAMMIILFSRSLTRPVYALTEAMKQISKENFNIILPENSILKEYAVINHGFNHMSRQLDNMINTVYKAQLAHKEAQLKNLQSQMNPHFLFNTLQLISWKAHEYEAYPVCDMISSLSYMLQTDLHSDDENSYTLRQELEYIHQYSFIIKCKYNGKIAILINIPDELLDCRIPKLIIQPFLENSIRHGLEPKPSPGTVTVTIQKEAEDLICIIEDNGVGMGYDMLHNIQDSKYAFSQDESYAEKGHHIALSNIQERIRLLYGEKYGFRISSQLLKGTRVVLRIPFFPYRYDNADAS